MTCGLMRIDQKNSLKSSCHDLLKHASIAYSENEWCKAQVVEMKLAPIRNLVRNRSTINNKAVNDKIVTSAKMFLIFAFVAFFILLTYFYTSYFVQVAHKVNVVNLFSIINRFVFSVIFPSIMFINNVSLRNFVFYGVKNLIWK